jgi:hypothetical protein
MAVLTRCPWVNTEWAKKVLVRTSAVEWNGSRTVLTVAVSVGTDPHGHVTEVTYARILFMGPFTTSSTVQRPSNEGAQGLFAHPVVRNAMFGPEDKGFTIVRNVGNYLPNDIA